MNAFANTLVGDIVSSGSFLDTEAFEDFEEKSAFDCVMRCVKTSGCRTIDYKRRGNRDNCFLNSNSRREVGLTTNDDYIHYDITMLSITLKIARKQILDPLITSW